jgi:hypothetical protein
MVLAVISSIIACSKQPTNDQPLLPAPVLISSPADTLVIERGIDAIPDADAIQVDWELNTAFAGYELYRAKQDEGTFVLLKKFGKTDSSYIDYQNITLNKRYYYLLKGFDKKQNESVPSDTVDYMVIEKAFNLSVTLADPIIFHWQVKEVLSPFYVLKVFDDVTGENVWLCKISSAFHGLEEQVTYNWDGKAGLSRLSSGRRYRWRVDIVGPSTRSGSESGWDQFVMP